MALSQPSWSCKCLRHLPHLIKDAQTTTKETNRASFVPGQCLPTQTLGESRSPQSFAARGMSLELLKTTQEFLIGEGPLRGKDTQNKQKLTILEISVENFATKISKTKTKMNFLSRKLRTFAKMCFFLRFRKGQAKILEIFAARISKSFGK